MPIVPPANAVSAVFVVRGDRRREWTDEPWTERLRTALRELSRGRPGRDQAESPDALKVVVHMDALVRRRAGELAWERELDRGSRGSATLAYNDMIETGGILPRYAWGPIHVTVDLFNPGNEAGEPGWDADAFEAIELVAHTTQLFPWSRGVLHDGTPVRPKDPLAYGKMAAYGACFGEVVALLAEALQPEFAFADVKPIGAFLARANVANPAGEGASRCYWDYLWPISVWSPALLAERSGLAEKLEALALAPEQLARVEPFERSGLQTTAKRLTTGALFVQYRTILGAERPGSRAAVDAPLAAQVGLLPLF